jgi:hypothetical protein
MRTRQLAAWPPIPAEQVPTSAEIHLLGDLYHSDRGRGDLVIFDEVHHISAESRKRWRERSQAFLDDARGKLRPYQQAALDEIAGSPGLLVGVAR